MSVYFADTARAYIGDEAAAEAIAELIRSLQAEGKKPPIERPYIVSITPVQAEEIPEFAQSCYEQKELVKFSAVFKALDKEDGEEYCRRMYEDGRIAFFSSVMEDMGEELIVQYAYRAEQDNKINFFALLLDHLPPEDLKQYAEKYYETGDIARFSLLLGYMTPEEKQGWRDRAGRDKKNNFYAVTEEEMSE